ncbi:MAG: 2-isopropylmalate synthase [Deltaproteobacteria bacterium]|nr:2-isopropylmalate synthase [Deltaproteobacteria bacterium]
MYRNPENKYRPFPLVPLDDRTWPSRRIEHPPAWCSVDLRDGNQALIEPMTAAKKQAMFELLLEVGLKEIEVGFPSASETDYDYVRQLIETNAIPDDVSVQVLTQAREHLIRRTFESLRGAKRAIVHLYNSTSTLQRRVVFGMDRKSVIGLAIDGVQLIRELLPTVPGTEIILQYSPESFTGTELDFALEICERVLDVWSPTPERKIILNLPATVEMSTPNVYADQIEWFLRNIKNRDSVILSVHPHNDRGTAVAAAELAMLAGADRVEGTLFGNGERTGNVDLVTLALNMYSQGLNPGLDFSDIDRIRGTAERCTALPIHPRHPYAGELVFTAFSGSHQDAIKKGFAALKKADDGFWDVPYLPIDPQDVGRSYEAVVRINSQSGKGGIAFLLERDFGLCLPRNLQVEFSQRVQREADATGEELSAPRIFELFEAEYLNVVGPLKVGRYRTLRATNGDPQTSEFSVFVDDERHTLEGEGTGPLDAFVSALAKSLGQDIAIKSYHEHAREEGSNATAVAYVELRVGGIASSLHGVGLDRDIVAASLKAIANALNRGGVRVRPDWIAPPASLRGTA